MKHRTHFLILAVLLLMTLLSGCVPAQTIRISDDSIPLEQSVSQSVTPALDEKLYNTPTPDQLTYAQAMDIALSHSGYTAEEVQYLYTEYEIDDRVPQYEVQFYVNKIEFEYEIHAESGEILSYDLDL